MGKKEKQQFCICRSSNGEGFMVFCDNCEEWYHGRCIKLKKKEADKFPTYYCKLCREKNPSLTDIMYAHIPEEDRPKSEQPTFDKHQFDEVKTERKPIPKKKLSQQQQQQSTTSQTAQPRVQPLTQAKSSPIKRKPTQRARNRKGREEKRQCANPPCIYEAREDSKYCSYECGYAFNKERYVKHFIPKWRLLEKKHSQARLKKMKDLDQLEKDKVSVEELIRNLKLEKEQLEENISKIKLEAKRQAISKENKQSKENDDDDDDEIDDNEDVEEIVTGDASKTFCIMCGLTVPSSQIFKHWAACHKKQESAYNFTADVLVNPTCAGDENPKLYCHHQDKKTKRYCMHLESACPQHSNWHSDKDEVCGCPLNIMQNLLPDGSYCTELKKDCTLHYHWDKFRLAQLNMQRVQAFSRLDTINDRIRVATANLNDTYGGVVGVMLHNTIDHHDEENHEDLNVEA